MKLSSSVGLIGGVGPKTHESLAAAGIKTVADLIDFLPRTYEDYTGAENIANIKPGKVTIRARAETISTRYARRNMKITTATLVDNHGDKIQAVWFNQPYRERQLGKGGEFYFSGEFALKRNRYQLVAPSCEVVSSLPVSTDKIMPIYSTRAGLKPSLSKKLIRQIKPLISVLPETLPPEVVRGAGVIDRAAAVLQLHFPTSRAKLETARRRIAFEELFSLILAARMNRDNNQRLLGYSIAFNQDKIKQFVKGLPFSLTPAQRRAAWEIIQDMAKPVPMNRLLQGDVGSGKTVVAAVAAYQAVLGYFQVAVMVPTEVLATQHFATIGKLLNQLGVRVSLLTSATRGEARRLLLQQLADGSIDVIVGTHALFQRAVTFHSLGLVIIDEQHRFGVKQRQTLLTKTDDQHLPHLLAMTATPIPRSLQLTIFGDLDISTLDQLPAGRRTTKTKIILPNWRRQMEEDIKQELAAGRQVYYVTPLIAKSAQSEKTSAEELYKKILTSYPDYQVGILHGKMPADSKDRVIRQFEDRKIDILVSTTVIEVGVDIANATVMVIENADQFGLAQLHQLRGRVGRGEWQSYCYLIQNDSKPPTRRLKEIERSNDGFYLAEVDLAMRGAGEIYGTEQHGQLNLRIANLADTKMIKLASDEAVKFTNVINSNPTYLTNFSELSSIISKYQKVTTLN